MFSCRSCFGLLSPFPARAVHCRFTYAGPSLLFSYLDRILRVHTAYTRYFISLFEYVLFFTARFFMLRLSHYQFCEYCTVSRESIV